MLLLSWIGEDRKCLLIFLLVERFLDMPALHWYDLLINPNRGNALPVRFKKIVQVNQTANRIP